jgi:molybdopterin converting factor subunit 1
MRVRVRFFASHRERLGTDRVELDLPTSATVGELGRELARRYPAVAGSLGAARYAVNREYVPDATALREGDEVAIIPPVAGGGTGW